MKLIHKDINKEWGLIVPSSYSKMKDVLDKYKQNADTINILIVDDIDSDGFGSAKITYTKLSKIFPNCKIKINSQHGLTDLGSCVGFDLIIIVDSSSNLLETYKVLSQDVIIVDHHEYDKDQICPDNVTLVNSKDCEELKSISAGMLCYLVFTKYLEDCGIDDRSLFDIACMTLYSDIVPLDTYVSSCINKLISEKQNYSDLISSLNIYNEPINKSVMQFSIIPLINYTRRLGDTTTLKLLYDGKEDIAKRLLVQNKEISRTLLNILKEVSKPKEYKNFVFVDISETLYITNYPIEKFKGVYANQLQSQYEKPVIVGFISKDDKTEFSVSVRSNDVDSLTYFSKLCKSGGGHLQACGFTLDYNILPLILAGYNTYLDNYKHYLKDNIIEVDNYTLLDSIELLSISVDNEFRYSNEKPISLLVSNISVSNLENIDEIKNEFSLGRHRVKCYTKIPTGKELKLHIRPTLESYRANKYKLIGRFI